MGSKELGLPPILDRFGTLSGSSDCNASISRKARKDSESSILEVISRSPHSFSSSSCNSHVSGNHGNVRHSRKKSLSITDQVNNNSNKLGTLFEQTFNQLNRTLDLGGTRKSNGTDSSKPSALRTRSNPLDTINVRSNLSKPVFNKNSSQVTSGLQKPPLKRIKSESQKNTDRKQGKNSQPAISDRRLSLEKADSLLKPKLGTGFNTGKRVSLDSNGNRKDNIRLSQLNKVTVNTNRYERVQFESSDESDSEDEVDERVLEWLEGVREAEAPPEPEIEYSDTPPQTDNAIHIVYGES